MARSQPFQTVQGLEVRLGLDRAAQSVLPPSKHASGCRYEWLPRLSPFEVDPLPFPQPLIDPLTSSVTPSEGNSEGQVFVMEHTLQTHPGCPQGERNPEFVKLVGRAIAEGEDPNDIMRWAKAWNSRCVPPKDTKTIQDTVTRLIAKEWEKRQQAQAIQTQQAEPGFRFRPLSSVTPKALEFCWGERLVVGKLNLIAGPGSIGKTAVCCDIAARLSRGELLPGDFEAKQWATLFISAEDGIEDTLWHRCEASGADMSRVHVLGEGEDVESYHKSTARLLEGLKATPKIRLVIFDTLPDFIGDQTDDHKNSSIRQALRPIVRAAAEAGVVLLGVAHFRKGVEGNSASKLLGSVAYYNLSRAVLYALPNPDAEGERILWHEKGNLTGESPTLSYRVGEAARVSWLDGDVFVDDISRFLNANRRGGGGATKLAEAQGWLSVFLPEGTTRPANILAEAAAQAGYSKTTLHRAADALGVVKNRQDGTWSR